MKSSKLPAAVVVLGCVSLLTDLSSEMIYPLLPLFLSTTLNATAVALGVIEGAAESVAAFLKAGSGIWTDRTERRKPFILTGYSISGLSRPLIGLAGAWPSVLVLRVFDRVGKGIRTVPRDVLIADVTAEGSRGRAFGFHRAMDHAGAVVGPLCAALLLKIAGLSLRTVFLLSSIPAVLVIVLILGGVRETPRRSEPRAATAPTGGMGREFRFFLLALLIFTLGNSSDAFLLLRFSDSGVSGAAVAALWSLHHVVKMGMGYWGGILSDRFGSRTLVVLAWVLYGVLYLGFALVQNTIGMISLFLLYGVYFGLAEPSERAWIAELVAADRRGRAFGYYHATVGLAAFPASLLFGWLWHDFSPAIAFSTGAALAGLGAALLVFSRLTSPGKKLPL